MLSVSDQIRKLHDAGLVSSDDTFRMSKSPTFQSAVRTGLAVMVVMNYTIGKADLLKKLGIVDRLGKRKVFACGMPVADPYVLQGIDEDFYAAYPSQVERAENWHSQGRSGLNLVEALFFAFYEPEFYKKKANVAAGASHYYRNDEFGNRETFMPTITQNREGFPVALDGTRTISHSRHTAFPSYKERAML